MCIRDRLDTVYVNVSVRVYTVEIQYDFFAGIAFGKGKACLLYTSRCV